MISRLSHLAKQIEQHRANADLGCPAGWLSVVQIQRTYKFLNRSSASNRAKQLCDLGLLERIQYKNRSKRGSFSWSYCYRPGKGLKDLDAVRLASANYGQDTVPRGWVTVSDFCKMAAISRAAVFQMAQRHSLEFKHIRIRYGLLGSIKNVTHFKISDLKKLHCVK